MKRKELIEKLRKKGETPTELKRRYKKQINKIKKSFPEESAQRILKDMSYEDFLQNTLKRKLLKDKRSSKEENQED